MFYVLNKIFLQYKSDKKFHECNSQASHKRRLIEKAQNLSSGLSSTGLLVIHDSKGRGQHNMTEATRWQNVLNPLLNILDTNIESGRNNTALVDAAVQLNDNLAGAVVIDNLKLTNVTILLHHLQELDHHLRGRSDQDLSLSALLSVGNSFKAISQHRHFRHLD